ncbi:MAG: hypothetical protein JXR51_04085 [Bacteroidales bacterium]|nr:hypothetical protein [Bacteroidales bacterium]MBN2756335.1 hypothetical protein [Bacteroidales bacterium]
MGFGFNMIFTLIVFPLLIILTIIFFVAFIKTRKKSFVLIILSIWVFVIASILFLSIIIQNDRPIRLKKADIIGEYRIDTNFYRGKNARWQYNHFNFQITDNEEFIFTVLNESKQNKVYKGCIIWKLGPPDIWTVEMNNSTHHVIANKPVLYRSHEKFYYVFKSKYWNNLFFRKIGK